MELEQIFKLIDAGYTKADIEAMTTTKTEPTEAPVETETKVEPEPETKVEPEPETKVETKTETQPPAESPELSALRAQVEELTAKLTETQKTIHNKNIIESSSQPAGKEKLTHKIRW